MYECFLSLSPPQSTINKGTFFALANVWFSSHRSQKRGKKWNNVAKHFIQARFIAAGAFTINHQRIVLVTGNSSLWPENMLIRSCLVAQLGSYLIPFCSFPSSQAFQKSSRFSEKEMWEQGSNPWPLVHKPAVKTNKNPPQPQFYFVSRYFFKKACTSSNSNYCNLKQAFLLREGYLSF